MTYQHTQRAPVYIIALVAVAYVGGFGVLLPIWGAVGGKFVFGEAIVVPLATAMITAIYVYVSFCRTMAIRDEQEAIVVTLRCGPIRLNRLCTPYADITTVESGRISFLAGRESCLLGGGFQYVAGRGWTYRGGSFECVVVHLKGQNRRRWIITDDVAGMVAFLKKKIEGTPIEID
jgi:hypothetical protein